MAMAFLGTLWVGGKAVEKIVEAMGFGG